MHTAPPSRIPTHRSLHDQGTSYGVSQRLKGFQARSDEIMYFYPASVEG